MPGLEIAPLETAEAEPFWRVFLAGRTDVPTTDVRLHIDRYLALALEEQRSYFAFRESGRIVGTVRIAGSFLGTFSILPAERRWTRDAILLGTTAILQGEADRIVASFEDSYLEDFEKLGFVERFSRIRMEASLGKTDPPSVPMSHPEVTDVEDIVRFLMHVYEGHIEQQFGMHTGSDGEWRDYVTGIWKGDSGTYLPVASWAARDSAGLSGVALVTHWMGSPLLSELGVRGDARRRGLGRALVVQSMNALVDLGYDRLGLYVTVGNNPAVNLYKALGFRQVGGRSVNALREL
ncbi:MAG: GNAT family N-acetyltransferase [Methanobacteriota archaeon]|nr:MAG: GNAT family N-acetyltransferase [Euryarchaeota archaeon]